MRRIAGIAAWACLLALGGLVVGIAAFIRNLAHPPAWYEPVVVVVGVAGIGLTVAAFPTIRRRWQPWALLGAATVMLILATVLTITA